MELPQVSNSGGLPIYLHLYANATRGEDLTSHRKIVACVGHTQILEILLFLIPFIFTILAVHILVSWTFTLKS